MKFLKMSMEKLLEMKMLINIEDLDGPYHLQVLKSLQIVDYVHLKQSKSECKLNYQRKNIPLISLKPLINRKQKKDGKGCTKDWDLYGQDKSHTQ